MSGGRDIKGPRAKTEKRASAVLYGEGGGWVTADGAGGIGDSASEEYSHLLATSWLLHLN